MSGSFSRTNFQRQAEAGECGLACLAMVARHHGLQLRLSELRQQFPQSSRGTTAKGLVKIADQLRMNVRPLRCSIESLNQIRLPAILHWDLNHFVVLVGIRKSGRETIYRLADPAKDLLEIPFKECSRHFTGVVLELEPATTFQRREDRAKLRLRQLWTRISGFFPALARLLALSLIMQIISLATPFFLQLTVDSVVPAQDFDLGRLLLVGFAGLLIINTATALLRNWLVVDLSSTLTFQTAINLFRHTVFLPVSWFEKRHLGDIVSRFNSLQPISDVLSKGVVAGMVDGVLSVATLVLMFIYSPLLASIAVLALTLIIASKIALYHAARFTNANLLAAQATESSSFIESMRGIQTIKAFCEEEGRQRIWQAKKTETIRATVALGKLSGSFDVVQTMLLGLELLVFVYVSGLLVIKGSLTLGMIFAYQAYRQNFMGASTRLIDQLVSYKLLDVQLDRISDIAFAVPEASISLPRGEAVPLSKIEMKGISFRYGHDSPLVLENLNLEITGPLTVAVIGPSGAGKSTLLKVFSGLLVPTAGSYLVDGEPLQSYGARRLRGQLGVVSQDDLLFAGTLAENITFFDSEYDPAWLVECCRCAAIHEEIDRMPLRYESTVGDMGSALSGGQKQRILLARALYKRPALLVMDEGTAHLDIETEARVSAGIRSLGIPRLIAAHRPETIQTADRILAMVNRQLVNVTASIPGRNGREVSRD